MEIVEILGSRAAELADAYGAVVTASWRAAYRGIFSDAYLQALDPKARANGVLQSVSAARGVLFFVMFELGRPIGALCIGPCHDEGVAARTGEVLACYLVPEAWGKGHGRALMDFALARLAADGFDGTVLWVLRENGRARRFYARHGFAADGAEQEVEVGGETGRAVRYWRVSRG